MQCQAVGVACPFLATCVVCLSHDSCACPCVWVWPMSHVSVDLHELAVVGGKVLSICDDIRTTATSCV